MRFIGQPTQRAFVLGNALLARLVLAPFFALLLPAFDFFFFFVAMTQSSTPVGGLLFHLIVWEGLALGVCPS
ncbi:MAG: hypothetical protein ACE5IP_01615 [Terriglobia bacterium]